MFYNKNTDTQLAFFRDVMALIGKPEVVYLPWSAQEIDRLKRVFSKQNERCKNRKSYAGKARTKDKKAQILSLIASLPNGYPYERDPATGQLVPFNLDSDLHQQGYDALAVLPSRINQTIRHGSKGYWKQGRKFVAEISVCGQAFKLGSYNTAEDARDVYLWAKSITIVLLAEAYKKHLLEGDYLALMLVSGRVNG